MRTLLVLLLTCATAFGGEEICLTGIISQNGPVVTYSAKCCPDGTSMTFQGLPGLTTDDGEDCEGEHCFIDIKVKYGISVQLVLQNLLSNKKLLFKFLGEIEDLKPNAADDAQAADNASANPFSTFLLGVLAEDQKQLGLFLDRGLGKNLAPQKQADFNAILGKYAQQVASMIQDETGRTALTFSPTEETTEDPEVSVYGFDSELERFGYGQRLIQARDKETLKEELRGGAMYRSHTIVRCLHPTTGRPIFVQLVVIELPPGKTASGEATGGGYVGFGFQVRRPDRSVPTKRGAEFIQLSSPDGGSRHCLMLKHGSIVFGVALAQHRRIAKK
ncbi:MAG: hypothetical protein AAFU85_02610 [Planctomycetota bacterium]